MVLYCAALMLLLFSSVIPESDGRKGYINNIQVASGGSIAFPNLPANAKNQEIPLEMLLRMNDVADMGTFIENFLYSDVDNTTLPQFSFSAAARPETFERKILYRLLKRKHRDLLDPHDRVSKRSSERSQKGTTNGQRIWARQVQRLSRNWHQGNVIKAQMAVCKPELKTVSLKPETDFTSYYHPSCIRIERCGGCCGHSLLTCIPAESEIVNVGVVVAEYKGGDRLVFKNLKTIPVERHTKCNCDCKIQPQNCTKSQVYNKGKCSCECSNTDAERKCNAEVKTKIWSKNRCLCLCREEYECSTGYYFDLVSCRCELQEGRRKMPDRPWIVED